jgi:hypothetical protein
MRRVLFLFVLYGFLMSTGDAWATEDMNAIAERYVHLVLALGQHDPDYVDAFYGLPEWKTQAEKEKESLDAIGAEAAELSAILAKPLDAATSGDEMLKLRREYLQKQVAALAARVRMLKGEKLKFDDESRALYDAVAPTFQDSHFDQIIKQLEAKIPGDGPLWERYEKWRKPFVIPKEKLDAVFQAAIKECRARTLAHVALPPNESFTVEYVTNKPWGGYNWYKGNFHRSRDRSRGARRLSRPSRLQFAAGKEAGPRSRLGGVFGLRTVLPAIARRGRNGEFRPGRCVPD